MYLNTYNLPYEYWCCKMFADLFDECVRHNVACSGTGIEEAQSSPRRFFEGGTSFPSSA